MSDCKPNPTAQCQAEVNKEIYLAEHSFAQKPTGRQSEKIKIIFSNQIFFQTIRSPDV
ncbi:MAG: hypothetical protein ABIK67_00775 [candidate division WOR-3 bacterium]